MVIHLLQSRCALASKGWRFRFEPYTGIRGLLSVGLLLAFLAGLARAARCSQGDLLERAWPPGMDARQRSALALLNSRDGYLWVGTREGLMRFDGVTFTRFTAANTPGIAGDRISFGSLWEDTKGAIWAGTEFSGVIRNDHGHFQTLQEQQGLLGRRVLRIDGDETGAVWVYTQNGVSRWRDERFEQVRPEQDGTQGGAVVPFSNTRSIDFAKTGIWRHTASEFQRFAYGHWTRFPTPPGEGRPFEDDIRMIYEDHERRVWYSIRSKPGPLYCVDHGALRVFEGLPREALVSFEDSKGFLWLTDNHAHSALWKDGRLYPLPGLHAPFLLQVLETPDGSVWAGTLGTDLFQFRRQRFEVVPTAGSPEAGSVLFEQRNGTVWAAGTSVLRSAPGGSLHALEPVPAAHTPANWSQIYALSEDTNGNLLVGSQGVEGVERLKDRRFEKYTHIPGTVRAILLTQLKQQWIGTSMGLFLYDEAKQRTERVSAAAVRCLFSPRPDTVWAGTSDGPLLFVHGQQQSLGANPPWKFGTVIALKQNRTGETWMGTEDHGIVLFSGNSFHAFGSAEGLPTDNMYSLAFGDSDDLWLGSDVGLLRVRGGSVRKRLRDASSKLQFTLFDAEDGLPATTLDPLGNQGTLRRPDGDLWFGTERGIAVVRPSAFRARLSQTRSVVEEHVIDQSGLLPGSEIILHPRESNLEIHYTGLGSLKPEQLSFRYRLVGYDRDWVYAHARRVAYYSHLPPGSYTFRVQAADNDGDGWERQGASAAVQVLTPFYRTFWFAALVLLLLLGTIFILIDRRRRRYVEEQRTRQTFTHRLITTQEGERKRIAHELHDSLGQHLVLIRNLALLPFGHSPSGSANQLSAIADQAAVALKEVETISYDLRPYQLDRLGLTKAVLACIQTFERSSSVKIECKVDNVDDFFPKEMEINLYRIVQEALANVLRHAEATVASVSLVRTGPALRLVIEDNGRGLASTAMGHQGSGLGLVGMQERAEALGGRTLIESRGGAGTKIIVEVNHTS